MKLRYDPRALADLNDIHEFIAGADADAARRAILRIERAINRLMTAPWSGRKGALFRNAAACCPEPSLCCCSIEDDVVTIVAVLHTRRQRRY